MSGPLKMYMPGRNFDLKKLPINLQKKYRREQRNRNELKPKKKRKQRKKKPDAVALEAQALANATEKEVRKILEGEELLSDIPADITPEELLGEIALAQGDATTVYVKRDGLSTLTIVLPQKDPTISNLKRAIETTSRAQYKREQRQRQEERLTRRLAALGDAPGNSSTTRQPQAAVALPMEPLKGTGELVCSATHNGHLHRPHVSWRFLWRAYALFNVDTNEPVSDQNGRKLLSECGIENAGTLKFCSRVKYFGRKRQR